MDGNQKSEAVRILADFAKELREAIDRDVIKGRSDIFAIIEEYRDGRIALVIDVEDGVNVLGRSVKSSTTVFEAKKKEEGL